MINIDEINHLGPDQKLMLVNLIWDSISGTEDDFIFPYPSDESIVEIKKLTGEKRILLAQDIWDSIEHKEKAFQLSKEMKTELEARLERLNKGEGKFHTLEEVKKCGQKKEIKIRFLPYSLYWFLLYFFQLRVRLEHFEFVVSIPWGKQYQQLPILR